MTTLTSETTVGEWVTRQPARSRIFEKLGIDYCCGGKRPLADACREKGLDPTTVVALLAADEAAGQPTATPSGDWASAPMAELCDHIEATHHAYLRTELPRLEHLTAKVASAHGQRHAELLQVRQVFLDLKTEMESHMMKEERILFPMIRQLDDATDRPCFHCGSVANPIRVMEMEHSGAGDALSTFNRLTGGYVAPPDACNTYRAMLEALARLEADMHQHVHKENNILFPRAIAAEAKLSGAAR